MYKELYYIIKNKNYTSLILCIGFNPDINIKRLNKELNIKHEKYLYRFLLSLRKNNFIVKNDDKQYRLTKKGNKIFNILLTL